MLTRDIVRYASAVDYRELPRGAIEKAKICCLDWLIVTYLAARQDASALLEGTLLQSNGSDATCVLVGRSSRASPLNAAFINGYNGHYLDYDDMHIGLNGHPSAVIYPAILAAGELISASGKDVITSFVIGSEIACRLGLALNPTHYDLGWHATSTLGAIGAAVGVSRLLRLDQEQMTNAIGLAATQSSGLRAVFGGMAKPLNIGRAANAGLLAASLASKGFTSDLEVLDGHIGFCNMVTESWDAAPIREGLGQQFSMERIIIKRYPACYCAHPLLEAASSIRRQTKLLPSDIAYIKAFISPLTDGVARHKKPKNAMQARFSSTFCVAIGLAKAERACDGFTEDQVKDSEIAQLMAKVNLIVDGSIRHDQRIATVEVGLNNGQVHRVTSDMSNENPSDVSEWTIVETKLNATLGIRKSKQRDGSVLLERAKALDDQKRLSDYMELWA